MNAELTDTVKDFIAKHVKSLWQLELILYLQTAEEPLTARELAQALYLSREAIGSSLRKFTKVGLTLADEQEPPRYSLSSTSDELRRAIEETSKAFATQRVDVINLIYSENKKQESPHR